METIFLLLLASIAITTFVFTEKIKEVTKKAEREQDRLKFLLKKYDGLTSRENFERQLDSSIKLKENQISTEQIKITELLEERQKLQIQIDKLKLELSDFEDEVYIQSFGIYQPQYSFLSSEDYSTHLKQIKIQLKEMRQAQRAVISHSPLIMNNSRQEGQKLSDEFRKLVLTIFDGECSSIISKVKPSNISASETKIKKRFGNLNKSSQVIYCEITEEYLILKLRELHLQYELECKEQEARVQNQTIQQQINQQKRERDAVEKAMKEAEEAADRKKQFQQELEKALQEKSIAPEQDNERLELRIQQLEEQISKEEGVENKAIERSRKVKRGIIYVVSNVGSLGQDIYRICMTKSSRPEEYVSNMTPIVPFPFDVHYKIISEEASDTLERLHQRFKDKKVNKANNRREFFKISLNEIIRAVQEIKSETGVLKSVQLEKSPQAYEYRRTIAAEQTEN